MTIHESKNLDTQEDKGPKITEKNQSIQLVPQKLKKILRSHFKYLKKMDKFYDSLTPLQER